MKRITLAMMGLLACAATVDAQTLEEEKAMIMALSGNVEYAAASLIVPIVIPRQVAASANDVEEELLEAFISRNILIYTGRMGRDLSIRHGFIIWMEFRDMRAGGRIIRFFANDKITLLFADGSTLRMSMIGPFAPSGLFFQVVHPREAREHPGKGRHDHGGYAYADSAPLFTIHFEWGGEDDQPF